MIHIVLTGIKGQTTTPLIRYETPRLTCSTRTEKHSRHKLWQSRRSVGVSMTWEQKKYLQYWKEGYLKHSAWCHKKHCGVWKVTSHWLVISKLFVQMKKEGISNEKGGHFKHKMGNGENHYSLSLAEALEIFSCIYFLELRI